MNQSIKALLDTIPKSMRERLNANLEYTTKCENPECGNLRLRQTHLDGRVYHPRLCSSCYLEKYDKAFTHRAQMGEREVVENINKNRAMHELDERLKRAGKAR